MYSHGLYNGGPFMKQKPTETYSPPFPVSQQSTVGNHAGSLAKSVYQSSNQSLELLTKTSLVPSFESTLALSIVRI